MTLAERVKALEERQNKMELSFSERLQSMADGIQQTLTLVVRLREKLANKKKKTTLDLV